MNKLKLLIYVIIIMSLLASTIYSEALIDDWYDVSESLVKECISWGGTATAYHRNSPDNLAPQGYTSATLQVYYTNYSLDNQVTDYYYEMAWYVESMGSVESYIQLEDDIRNIQKVDETEDIATLSKGYVDYSSQRHYTKAVLFYKVGGQEYELVTPIIER